MPSVTIRTRRTTKQKIYDALKSLTGFKKPEVHVGFPKGEADQDVIDRAIWNEFGTRGGGWGGPIPERPFLRNAMRANKGKYVDGLKTASRNLITGKITLDKTLSQLGIMAQGDVQTEITTLSTPPNSPVTIALKGSSNPLIDSGEMRQAVTYKVKKR